MNATYHQKLLALPAPKSEDAWRNDWCVVATYRLSSWGMSMYRVDVYTSIGSQPGEIRYPRGSAFDAVLVRRFGEHYEFPLIIYAWRDDLHVMPNHNVLKVMADLIGYKP